MERAYFSFDPESLKKHAGAPWRFDDSATGLRHGQRPYLSRHRGLQQRWPSRLGSGKSDGWHDFDPPRKWRWNIWNPDCHYDTRGYDDGGNSKCEPLGHRHG